MLDANIIMKKICDGNTNSIYLTENNRVFICESKDDNY